MPESVGSALQDLKQELSRLYGERLRGVFLYGSYARGDFTEDSDVDVLIVLEGKVQPGKEIDHCNAVVSDICLRYDLLIATHPISVEDLETGSTPFLENVRREALPL